MRSLGIAYGLLYGILWDGEQRPPPGFWRFLFHLEIGLSYSSREIAAEFAVSVSTARAWLRDFRAIYGLPLHSRRPRYYRVGRTRWHYLAVCLLPECASPSAFLPERDGPGGADVILTAHTISFPAHVRLRGIWAEVYLAATQGPIWRLTHLLCQAQRDCATLRDFTADAFVYQFYGFPESKKDQP